MAEKKLKAQQRAKYEQELIDRAAAGLEFISPMDSEEEQGQGLGQGSGQGLGKGPEGGLVPEYEKEGQEGGGGKDQHIGEMDKDRDEEDEDEDDNGADSGQKQVHEPVSGQEEGLVSGRGELDTSTLRSAESTHAEATEANDEEVEREQDDEGDEEVEDDDDAQQEPQSQSQPQQQQQGDAEVEGEAQKVEEEEADEDAEGEVTAIVATETSTTTRKVSLLKKLWKATQFSTKTDTSEDTFNEGGDGSNALGKMIVRVPFSSLTAEENVVYSMPSSVPSSAPVSMPPSKRGSMALPRAKVVVSDAVNNDDAGADADVNDDDADGNDGDGNDGENDDEDNDEENGHDNDDNGNDTINHTNIQQHQQSFMPQSSDPSSTSTSIQPIITPLVPFQQPLLQSTMDIQLQPLPQSEPKEEMPPIDQAPLTQMPFSDQPPALEQMSTTVNNLSHNNLLQANTDDTSSSFMIPGMVSASHDPGPTPNPGPAHLEAVLDDADELRSMGTYSATDTPPDKSSLNGSLKSSNSDDENDENDQEEEDDDGIILSKFPGPVPLSALVAPPSSILAASGPFVNVEKSLSPKIKKSPKPKMKEKKAKSPLR